MQHVIPAGYEDVSDESTSLWGNITADGCCQPDSPEPQGVIAVPCVNITLRKEDKIIKVHVLNMKHMSTDELERIIEGETS